MACGWPDMTLDLDCKYYFWSFILSWTRQLFITNRKYDYNECWLISQESEFPNKCVIIVESDKHLYISIVYV